MWKNIGRPEINPQPRGDSPREATRKAALMADPEWVAAAAAVMDLGCAAQAGWDVWDAAQAKLGDAERAVLARLPEYYR